MLIVSLKKGTGIDSELAYCLKNQLEWMILL